MGTGALVVLAFGVSLAARAWPVALLPGYLLLAAAGCLGALTWLLVTRRTSFHPGRAALPLGAILLLLVLMLRLAFLKGLLLPPNFDVAQHYLIVQDILSPTGRPGRSIPCKPSSESITISDSTAWLPGCAHHRHTARNEPGTAWAGLPRAFAVLRPLPGVDHDG